MANKRNGAAAKAEREQAAAVRKAERSMRSDKQQLERLDRLDETATRERARLKKRLQK